MKKWRMSCAYNVRSLGSTFYNQNGGVMLISMISSEEKWHEEKAWEWMEKREKGT